MDATDSSPRRTSSIIRRFSSIERSRLPPRVSVCFATSTVDVSIFSPKWTRTPCPSLRTHHRRMRCQGSDGGDRTLTDVTWFVREVSTANDANAAWIPQHGRSVGWHTEIAGVQTILHPLSDVAVHVMQAERVRRIGADGHRLLEVIQKV